MPSDVDDILNKIGASDDRGEVITNDKVIPFERKQEQEPEKETIKRPLLRIKLNAVKSFYLQ